MMIKRLENAVLAAAMTAVFPLLVLMMASGVRRSFAPADPAVLMWWSDPFNDAAFLGLGIAIVAGLGLAIAILARPAVAWWKIARWVWAGSVFLALVTFAFGVRAEVRVYANRIVTTTTSGARSSVPMHAAEAVEVWCDLIGRRRNSDIPTIGYTIHFPDRKVALRSGMGDQTPAAARAWFRKVDTLDREVLAAVPHVRYGEAHDVNCVRALRGELGEADFLAARRMLGITDGDFRRRYAEPHEAWSRSAVDTR